MTGWVSFFAGFSAPIATAALVFSDYLGYFFPALKERECAGGHRLRRVLLPPGPGQLVASLLIAAFTALNCFGIGRTAKVQNVLTSTKLIVLVAFLVLGFAFGTGSWSHFSEPAVRTSTSTLPTQFVVSLLWVMFGYSGWNAATYVAEEVRKPERTLPLALASGSGIVAALISAAERDLYLRHAARIDERRDRGRLAGGGEPVRTQCRRHFQRADGNRHRFYRKRRDHHRPARLLCDGEEPRLFQSRRRRAPALAYPDRRHHRAGALRHGDDDHALPATADLHRDEPDAVHRPVGGVALRRSGASVRDGSGCARWILPGR